MKSEPGLRTGGDTQFVFGYASLMAQPAAGGPPEGTSGGFVAELPGYVRVWGVAMDNGHDLPGYKYYTRPDGYRPAIYVAFLDLAEAGPAGSGAGSPVTGVCLPVEESALGRLDARERNYERVDISDLIPAVDRRVWTYRGTAEGRERLLRGRRLGTAVIDAAYLRLVRAGFAVLGGAQPREPVGPVCAHRSPDPGDLPVLELVRHDLA